MLKVLIDTFRSPGRRAVLTSLLMLAVLFVTWLPDRAEAAGETLSLKALQDLKAAEMTKPILEAFPGRADEIKNADLLMIKAWALRFTGRYEDASTVYDEVLALEPNRLAARYERALCLFALKRTADVGTEAAEIAKRWPDSMEYLALKHRISTDQAGNKDNKSEWGEKLEHYKPRSAAEELFKADWLFSYGQYGEALRLYRGLQKELPGSVVPFLREAEVLIKREKYQEAVEAIDRVIAQNARCGAAWRIKGEALTELHSFAEALKCFEKSEELGVESARLFAMRGYMFATQRSYREAVASYSLAIERRPENYSIYYHRSIAYLHLGEQLKAYADLTKATEIAKDKKPELYYRKGMLARSLGFRQDAIKAFEKFLQLAEDKNPYRAEAIASLAELSY